MDKKLNPEQILLCYELHRTYYSYLLKIMKYSSLFMPGMTFALAKFFVPDTMKAITINILGFLIIFFTLFKLFLILIEIRKLNYKQLISDINNNCYLTEICSIFSYAQPKKCLYNISMNQNDSLIICHPKCINEIMFQHNICKIISFNGSKYKIAIPLDISRLLFNINI